MQTCIDQCTAVHQCCMQHVLHDHERMVSVLYCVCTVCYIYTAARPYLTLNAALGPSCPHCLVNYSVYTPTNNGNMQCECACSTVEMISAAMHATLWPQCTCTLTCRAQSLPFSTQPHTHLHCLLCLVHVAQGNAKVKMGSCGQCAYKRTAWTGHRQHFTIHTVTDNNVCFALLAVCWVCGRTCKLWPEGDGISKPLSSLII